MTIFRTLFFLLLTSSITFGQQSVVFETSFDWDLQTFASDLLTEETSERVAYRNAFFSDNSPYIPTHSHNFTVAGEGEITVEVISVTFLDESPLTLNSIAEAEYIKKLTGQLNNRLNFNTQVTQDRRKYVGRVFYHPAILNNSDLKLVESIKIRANFYSKPKSITKSPPVTQSVLSSGEIYKVMTASEGVYKISGQYIQNKFGINLSTINVNQIQVFSNPGGKVALENSKERIDDLQEIPILVLGGEDGSLEADDALFFYAEGAEAWRYDESSEKLYYDDNPFDFENFAFIRFGVEDGKRINKQGSNVNDVPTINEFRMATRHEDNRINLLEDNFGTLGSGQEWYGEHFDLTRIQNFENKITITDIITGKDARLNIRFISRAASSNTLKANVDENTFQKSISATSLNSYTADFARTAKIEENFILNSTNPSVVIDYSSSNGEGWLDYLELYYQRKLVFSGSSLVFNNINTNSSSQINLSVSNITSNFHVWNVTNPGSAFRHDIAISGENGSFTTVNDVYQRFVTFDPFGNLPEPVFMEQVENQNLHSIMFAEMIIVTNEALFAEANRLKNHRESHTGTNIVIVDIKKVYNEFSGGRREPTAIRDFFKMVYDRDPDFRFGLMFGNGSYDYKGILFDRDEFNVIPVYETRGSLNAIRNFPSDDFYGLLSLQDGGNLVGSVDLAMGRIPVANSTQAATVVDKIIKYDTDRIVRGPWNLRTIFVADDEDNNLHISPSDRIAEQMLSDYPSINTKKIFFDSYPQVSTPGGERYPSVTEDLNGSIFNGGLTLCYLGHGGPSGWAQERVLQINDIENWSNSRSFPLFITATCSLASYDDPDVFSAGEKILVGKHGGIGLFTTCRAVYASDNTRLTEAVFKFMLAEEDDEPMQIGEILRNAKNDSSADTLDSNARKFLLLGDPSMQLLRPTYEVTTAEINNIDVRSTAYPDTINALSRMKVKGFISENDQKVSLYNGEIDITIFDKRTIRKTLAQDPRSSEMEFLQQNNIIFKGKAAVTNGDFEFEFVVPKDILFNVGKGKISYYATDGRIDAAGHYSDFLIGGANKNPIQDDTPPLVEVFLNDENFVFGGLTDENPLLYAKISDDIGINLSGASVGHDLTGELDEQSQNTYFLNDFYESELNNFSKGIVRYPLNKLDNGQHTISVRAWDVANNVGEGFTEFIVSDDPTDGLAHVLNYPNPFTDNTCFMFEHNFGTDVIDVQIDIFTISGKLVKTILHNTISEGYRVNDIKWDGNDDFGSPLGRGVYLYKIKVKAQSQKAIKESEFEKLVILK